MPAPADPPPVGIALLGLGVVGAGVYRALHDGAATYAQRSGRRIEVRHVAVRDAQRSRGVDLASVDVGTDPLRVATMDDVEVVVEVMGGEEPAATCIRAALDAGKHVVTANKEVMAKHGPELLAVAQQRGLELLYEASVGGGIPIIAALRRDLQANEIQRLQAIINGTTNFILTAMAHDGMSYAAALREAQRRGYAEADPTNDVEGTDAAFKLAILASLAFHATVHPDDVYREGITRLTPRDFKYAADLGYVIRLVATAARSDDGLDVRVHPALLSAQDPLARVDGVLNAVAVEGDLLGRAIFEGEGAGAKPTTSAVIADLLDVVHGLVAERRPRPLRPTDPAPCIRAIDDLHMRYYLRILVRDRPGVLAELGQIFAQNDISIASLLQVEADAVAGTAELIITTHTAGEADVQRFLQAAAETESVCEVGIRIRMEGS
ncbi:MAG: homoserine dehydrogenase [Dehalococcoidia bacterium]